MVALMIGSRISFTWFIAGKESGLSILRTSLPVVKTS